MVLDETYTNITRSILDSVQVGDMVKCNGWTEPMCVKGVSENYFVMTGTEDGEDVYSICEKKLRTAGIHNAMEPGWHHIGPDNMIFGWMGTDYAFNDEESTAKYLQALEAGEIEISERHGCALWKITIKRG